MSDRSPALWWEPYCLKLTGTSGVLTGKNIQKGLIQNGCINLYQGFTAKLVFPSKAMMVTLRSNVAEEEVLTSRSDRLNK